MTAPRLATITLLLTTLTLAAPPRAAAMVDAPPAQAKAGSKGGGGADPGRYRAGQVIVRFRSEAREERRAEVRTRHGLRKVKDHRLTHGELAELTGRQSVEEAVARLRADPAVLSAQPNYVYRVAGVPDDELFGLLWGLDNTGQYIGGTRTNAVGVPGVDIDAPEAWDITLGDPAVVVGVIDTAIDVSHPDLAANVWTNPGEIPGDGIDNDHDGYVDDVHGWNFFAGNASTWKPGEHFHGTHVAGTIAAQIGNAMGVAGVAPRVQIMQLQFLGPDGFGYTSDAVEALAYAKAMGVRITSNSWGGGDYDAELHDAICSYDGVFVAAAGNAAGDSDAAPLYPAAYDCPNIVSVAAIDNSGGLASFSNRGATTVDVGAPGVDVLSTLPQGQYGWLSGTSMATPHVSGVAALALSMQPGLSGPAVRQLLVDTAKPLQSLQGKTVSGGLVSAANAVHALEFVTNPRDGAIEVPPDEVITITYITAVQAGPTFGTIGLARDGVPVQATAAIAGAVLTITPAAPLPWDGTYTVNVPAGAVQDATGRGLRACTLSFKTHDTVPPILIGTDPRDGAVNVGGGNAITLTFTEPVRAGPAMAGVTVATGGVAVTAAASTDRDRLVLDPQWSLARSSTYVVTVPAGAVTDLSGNPQAALTFSFTTAADLSQPLCVSSAPPSYMREVPTTTDVTYAWTKTITLTPASSSLFLNCDGVIVPLAPSASANVLTLHPARTLPSSSACWGDVPEGAVQDQYGNAGLPCGIWFWTRDDQAPILMALTPADGATGVRADASVVVQLDEDVAPGAAIDAVRLVDDAGAAVPLAWRYLPDGYGFTYAYILEFVPQEVLQSQRHYTFTAPLGAITDTSPQRNPAPAIRLGFTTEKDVTPPRPYLSDPASLAIEVPSSQVIAVTFTEQIVPGSTWSSIALRSGAAAVPATVATSGLVLTVTPASPLQANATYTLTVPAGAVADRAGNPLAAPWTLTFKTPDTLPPTVTATAPAAGATHVATTTVPSLSFSEDARPGPAFGGIALRDQAGASVPVTSAFYVDEIGPIDTWLIVTPASALAANSVYTLSLPAGAVTDMRGNPSAAYAFSFSTPYTVVASAPASGASGVPVTQSLTLALLAPGAQGPSFGAVALTKGTATVPAAVTLDGSTLTVRPSAALSAATSYALTVPAGAVVSATGVPLTAFTLPFRTTDPNQPRVTNTDPPNGATGVPTTVQVNVYFSTATVQGPAWGAITLEDAGGAAVPATVEYYCDSEGCIESLLLVTPATPLAPGRGYTVTLPAGAVRDRSGNDSAAYRFGFTTQ